jgi:hypothetical protein
LVVVVVVDDDVALDVMAMAFFVVVDVVVTVVGEGEALMVVLGLLVDVEVDVTLAAVVGTTVPFFVVTEEGARQDGPRVVMVTRPAGHDAMLEGSLITPGDPLTHVETRSW